MHGSGTKWRLENPVGASFTAHELHIARRRFTVSLGTLTVMIQDGCFDHSEVRSR